MEVLRFAEATSHGLCLSDRDHVAGRVKCDVGEVGRRECDRTSVGASHERLRPPSVDQTLSVTRYPTIATNEWKLSSRSSYRACF